MEVITILERPIVKSQNCKIMCKPVNSSNDIKNGVLFKDHNIKTTLDVLEKIWGMESNPPDLRHEEPLDGLILTLLSQNTNDRNRDIAFSRLKDAYQQWDDVYRASPEDLVDLIRPAGLANIKAGRIRYILQMILEEFGELSLKILKRASREKVQSLLQRMPGVGPKTIACVLVFELGIPAFPVDTHVSRFCRRIGWVDINLKPEEVQQVMEGIIEPSRFMGAHLNIISHGRNICTARKPKCEKCPLRPSCNYHRREKLTLSE